MWLMVAMWAGIDWVKDEEKVGGGVSGKDTSLRGQLGGNLPMPSGCQLPAARMQDDAGCRMYMCTRNHYLGTTDACGQS